MADTRRQRRSRRSHTPEARVSGRATLTWISIALVVLDLIVYAQVSHHPFITFDDPVYIIENPHVLAGLTWRGVLWALTAGDAANWHPVTWISHMLDVQWFGLDAGGHHITSLVLHIANTLLLFGWLARVTGAPGRSAFVAALFGVHPLHVESVAWIAERKDVLSTCFWWLTLWAYVAYVRRPQWTRYALVLACFALGLASKPMLVTLPVVLLLLDVWPLRRLRLFEGRSLAARGADRPPVRGDNADHHSVRSASDAAARRVLVEKLPLVALAIASAVVTVVVQRQGGAVDRLDEIPAGLRVANALVSYVLYLGKMCWPVHLAIFYPFPRSIPIGLAVGALAVLVAISVAAVRALARWPYVAVGWFWYLVTLAPVIGIIQVGGQAMADRYTYVPLVGIFIIIAWGVPDLLERWTLLRRMLPVAAGAVIVACTAVAYTQAGYWRESLDLWQHAVDVTDDNYIAHDAIGTLLIGYGKPAEAVPHFAQAIAVKPTFAQAQYNFGVALMNQGKNAEAADHFRAAIRILPDFAEAHAKLGRMLAEQGQLDTATSEFTIAIRLKPDFAEAHEDLGTVLANQGKMDDAISHFTEAVRLQPSLAEPHVRLASALMIEVRLPEAIAEYSAALEVKPDFADAWSGRGVALARTGRIDAAISDLHTAVRLNPNFEAAYFDLGQVCRGAGRLDEAVSAFREVLRINPNNLDARRALQALVKH